MGLPIGKIEKEFEIGMRFRNIYWKFLKFIVNPISKDAYMILPIPDIGLKLSIHLPKPPELPLIHGHWSSHKLGIHEDVDAGLFSPQHWIEYANEFLKSFDYFQL